MNRLFILILSALFLLLVGCSANGGNTASSSGALSTDYEDALPAQSQLIVGTLKLADTELAVDAAQAAALAPLWQAVQTLSQSETTAAVELEALLKQIQETMSDAQVQAIADMKLTSADLQTTMQEAGIGFRPGNLGQDVDQAEGVTGRPGFGFPGGGNIGMAPPIEGGGGPPGEFVGGLGAGGAALTEEERATRVAERLESEDGDALNAMMSQAILAGLIERLQVTAGILDESEMTTNRPNQAFGAVPGFLPLISETTGISVENLQTEMAGGATPAEAITALGGDLDAVRAALIESLSNQPNVQDAEQQVDDFLNGVFGRVGPMSTPTPTP